MARKHAQILVSIWSDPDFVALPARAQRMYLYLLSQPKLTLCGVLDYMPRRWAASSSNLTVDGVNLAVQELEHGRFVIVDYETDELLVRTYVKHDGATRTWQLTTGMWSQWQNIQSPMLRDRVVEALPASAWEHAKATPPETAGQTKSDYQCHYQSDWSSAIQSPTQCQLPSTFHLPPSTFQNASHGPEPVSAPPVPVSSIDDGFEDWWKTYPKRNGQRIGKAACRRLWTRLSMNDRRDATRLLPVYEQSAGGFPKDPERYLSKRLWTDLDEDAAPTDVWAAAIAEMTAKMEAGEL